MKTCYEYIEFVKIAQKARTSIWVIRNLSSGTDLGEVIWKNGWRQYVFSPNIGTEYSIGCLFDIIAFVQDLNKAEERG